jgi:hypothetical protein
MFSEQAGGFVITNLLLNITEVFVMRLHFVTNNRRQEVLQEAIQINTVQVNMADFKTRSNALEALVLMLSVECSVLFKSTSSSCKEMHMLFMCSAVRDRKQFVFIR